MIDIDTIDRRDYGNLEAQVAQLKADVDRLVLAVEDMRDMMQQAKGGWRTIAWLSGVSGSVAFLAGWLLQHVKVTL